MRVLAVTYANRVPNNDLLYQSLGSKVALERLEVNGEQARKLRKTLAPFQLCEFDRVVLEIRAKHAMPQWRYLRRLPNLVLFEEDTWQNYVGFSKNRHFFTRYYKRALPMRILHSGFGVAQKTRAAGFNSVFLPKGYDSEHLQNVHGQRDIELGFVGRLEHSNYALRRQWLSDLQGHEPLQLLRSSTSQEYLELLNRIRFFVSADIQFGEHMIKNFEAMACGCVLFAFRQGADDAELGLVDMENFVAYSSMEELLMKLVRLRDNPDLAARIAAAGERLARTNHDHRVLGLRYHELLTPPLTACAHATTLAGLITAFKPLSRPMQEAANEHAGSRETVELFDDRDGLNYQFWPKGARLAHLRAIHRMAGSTQARPSAWGTSAHHLWLSYLQTT